MRGNSKKLDWTGIDLSTPLKQIDRIEKNNPKYYIHVLGYEKNKINIFRISKKHNNTRTPINLFLISNDSTNQYCWIKKYE